MKEELKIIGRSLRSIVHETLNSAKPYINKFRETKVSLPKTIGYGLVALGLVYGISSYKNWDYGLRLRSPIYFEKVKPNIQESVTAPTSLELKVAAPAVTTPIVAEVKKGLYCINDDYAKGEPITITANGEYNLNHLIKSVFERYTGDLPPNQAALNTYGRYAKKNLVKTVKKNDKGKKVYKLVFPPPQSLSSIRNKNYCESRKIFEEACSLLGEEFSCRMNSGYGQRTNPNQEFHKGWDLASVPDSSIRMIEDGLVVFRGRYNGFGNTIIVETSDYEVLFGHCSEIYVKKGQKVVKGQTIAKVGRNGEATGPHLHLEVRHNSQKGRVDKCFKESKPVICPKVSPYKYFKDNLEK